MTQSEPPATGITPAITSTISEASGTLRLTDFLSPHALQEIQDIFASVARMRTYIRDTDGRHLTEPTDVALLARSDEMLDLLLTEHESSDGRSFIAPILVEGQELGSIVVECDKTIDAPPASADQVREMAQSLGLPLEQIDVLAGVVEQTCGECKPRRAASIQFLYLLASSIGRLCQQGHQLRQRVGELSALFRLSTLLARHQDLQQVLDTAAKSACEVMRVKAASIRLLADDGQELVLRSVYNLSRAYMNKGRLQLEQAAITREALAGNLVYVEDMTTDARVRHQKDARREGLVSMLAAPISFQGRAIGTIRIYTGERHRFTDFEMRMLRAIGELLATAITNATLAEEWKEKQRIERQLHLAANVQQRMLPASIPHLPPFDIAARYVPSLELGGDFYDLIRLEGHLGLAIGDAVGKGVAASLLMALVRASLRAHAQDVYDIEQIMSRVNVALTRDTADNEFATLFYGVLDPQKLRLTYCNAGQEPPLLLRDGQITPMEAGGMAVGIDEKQAYHKGLYDLHEGDLLLLYTDGLTDAMNFDGLRFGRERVMQAMRDVATAPASDALNHILWEMRRFVGLNRPTDDTTLMVVKVGKK